MRFYDGIKRTTLVATIFVAGYLFGSCINENKLDNDSRVVQVRINDDGSLDATVQQLTGFDTMLYEKNVKLNGGGKNYKFDSEEPWRLFINSDTRMNFIY